MKVGSNTVDPRRIERGIEASAALIAGLSEQVQAIGELSVAVIKALQAGGKVLTAGNGGSAAEALHMAEELVGRFRGNRRSLPSVCLAADSTTLTCIGNDFGYDYVFSRQVEGLGCPEDLLVLFSTSGNAPNLSLALSAAKDIGMASACLLGRDGGPLGGAADYELIVPGEATERIQEAHQVVLHLILDAVELAFPPGEGV